MVGAGGIANWPKPCGYPDSRRITVWTLPGYDTLLAIETIGKMHVIMPNRSHPHEMTALELSERAEGYAALARDVAYAETRETFDRAAYQYARLAAERKAQEEQAKRH